MLFLSDQNNLTKRLGELRDSGGNSGAWVRAYRGKRKLSEDEISVDSYSSTIQLGLDHKVAPQWVIGAALSHTQGSSAVRHLQIRGSGENQSSGGAIYATWLGEAGDYADLIARYGRHQHEIRSRSSAGVIKKVDFDNKAYSLSAEYGKRLNLAQAFFIEPQIELSYGRFGEVSYRSDNTPVRQDRLTSLVGRAGVSLGRAIAESKIYARAGVVKEFDGKTTVRIGSRQERFDFGSTGVEIGAGANVKLGKKAYLYLDAEKSFRGKVTTSWQWNAGVRYDF